MGTEYTVLKIDEMTRLGDMHTIEKYYRYTVKTKGGSVITVDLSEKDSTPEKAPPILLKKAQDFDAILKA